MAHLRGFRMVAVVGLVLGVWGCSAAPASSAQADEIHRQAQEALARWDAAVAASAADRNVRPVVINDGSGTIDDLLIALDLGHDVALHLQGGQGDCDGSEV